MWAPIKATALSRTVLGNYVLNCQLRSKAHTAPTAPLVLHHTRIGKCALKIFGANCGINFFDRHRFSLVKAAMNAPHLCKLRKECLTGICRDAIVLKNVFISLFSNCQRRNKDHCAHLNWLPNWQLKTRRRSNTLLGCYYPWLLSNKSFTFNNVFSLEGKWNRILCLPGTGNIILARTFSLDSTFKLPNRNPWDKL